MQQVAVDSSDVSLENKLARADAFKCNQRHIELAQHNKKPSSCTFYRQQFDCFLVESWRRSQPDASSVVHCSSALVWIQRRVRQASTVKACLFVSRKILQDGKYGYLWGPGCGRHWSAEWRCVSQFWAYVRYWHPGTPPHCAIGCH